MVGHFTDSCRQRTRAKGRVERAGRHTTLGHVQVRQDLRERERGSEREREGAREGCIVMCSRYSIENVVGFHSSLHDQFE